MSESDLVEALKEKYLKSAFLDVFEEEPLPKESPLWKLPNVTISPHDAAQTQPQQVLHFFFHNFDKFTKGQISSLDCIVDIKRGY